jgi:hypothetical protein
MNNVSTFLDTFLIKRKKTLNLGRIRVFVGVMSDGYTRYAVIHSTGDT